MNNQESFCLGCRWAIAMFSGCDEKMDEIHRPMCLSLPANAKFNKALDDFGFTVKYIDCDQIRNCEYKEKRLVRECV